jgi:hypothetical protein
MTTLIFRALAVLLSTGTVLAFSETVPIVAWSSHSFDGLDRLLPSKVDVSDTVNLLESILFHDDICDNDAVVLVEQPDLHASDLRTLPPTSLLAQVLSSAPSSRQFPYVRHDHASMPFNHLAESISRRCDSRIVHFEPGSLLDGSERKKHVVCMNMPRVEGLSVERKGFMIDHSMHVPFFDRQTDSSLYQRPASQRNSLPCKPRSLNFSSSTPALPLQLPCPNVNSPLLISLPQTIQPLQQVLFSIVINFSPQHSSQPSL